MRNRNEVMRNRNEVMRNNEVLIHKDENLSTIVYELLIKDGFDYFIQVTMGETFKGNNYFNYSDKDIRQLFDHLYDFYSENIIEDLSKNFSTEKSDYEDESLLMPVSEFYETNKDEIIKECFDYFIEEFKERVYDLLDY